MSKTICFIRAKTKIRKLSVMEVLYADDVCLMTDCLESPQFSPFPNPPYYNAKKTLAHSSSLIALPRVIPTILK
ncbi:hypothetical protein JYU34_008453 [Plutella xylostella]|uniref:Uncharacterized protein n=1 Tax=Plutella xylostella TaxID=51655 RepID=A0ABQ7QL40_PLUXY|nr:hypothetical protein JYU34_008453 [Plutella xylostella]